MLHQWSCVNILILLTGIVLTVEASTVPIENGNQWVFMYERSYKEYDNIVTFRSGKLCLVISDVSTRNDSTFFTLLYSDSVINAIPQIVDSTSSTKMILYADSIFPANSQIVSFVDVCGLLSNTRLNDTLYEDPSPSNTYHWSRSTDSITVVINGECFPFFATTQIFYRIVEKNGFSKTEKLTQWIDQIGPVKCSYRFIEGYNNVLLERDSSTLITLISFNDTRIQYVHVNYRPVLRTGGNQFVSNHALRQVLLRTNLSTKSIPGFHFNLRGQALPGLRKSQIIIQVPGLNSSTNSIRR